jgi:hypothetical protein
MLRNIRGSTLLAAAFAAVPLLTGGVQMFAPAPAAALMDDNSGGDCQVTIWTELGAVCDESNGGGSSVGTGTTPDDWGTAPSDMGTIDELSSLGWEAGVGGRMARCVVLQDELQSDREDLSRIHRKLGGVPGDARSSYRQGLTQHRVVLERFVRSDLTNLRARGCLY